MRAGMQQPIRRAALAVLAAALAACGGSAPAPEAPAKPAAKPTAAAAGADAGPSADADGGLAGAPSDADGGPEGSLAAEYVYSPIGKRDPFRSFFEDTRTVTQAAGSLDPLGRCGPLCRWEIDQLKLVGIVSGVASPLAMVEDPDGRGYMIRRGSYIGKRAGKISDIRRDMLVVTELLRRPDGTTEPAKTEMKLREKKQTRKDDVVDLSAPEGGTSK